MSKKNNHTLISASVFVILMIATFVIIAKNSDFHNLKTALLNSNPVYIIAALLCMGLCVLCEGEAVRVICGSLGCGISRRRAFVYACNDYYFSAITPSATGGQPAMAYYMSKDGIPFHKSSIALLLTLTAYMSVLLILGLMAVVWHMDLIAGNILMSVLTVVGILLSGVVITMSLAAMFKGRLVERAALWAIALGARLNIIKNTVGRKRALHRHMEEYRLSAEYIKQHPLVTFKVFGLCVIQRIFMLAITYFVYRALGLRGKSFLDIMALQAILMLTVTTLPIPGAVGVSEGMFFVIFAGTFPAELMTPAVLLTRGINFYFSIAVAGIITMINHIVLIRRDKKNTA